MILLFTYNRSNIWPVQDIGLLRAISNNYKKNTFHLKDLLLNFKKNFHHFVRSPLGIYGDLLMNDTILTTFNNLMVSFNSIT